MLKVILVTFLFFLTSQDTNAKTFTIKNQDRFIQMIGVVDSSALLLAQQIDALSLKSSRPIYMLINSPGGAVGPGMAVVDSIRMAKDRGVKFKCAVGVLAASMAFIMLSHCDERYTLPESKLLFHPISLGVDRARVQELFVDIEQTINQEKRIMAGLQRVMGLEWRKFHMHYFAETFWAASELQEHTKNSEFLIIVDRIEGAGDNLFKYRRPGLNLFFGGGNSNVERVIERFEGER